MNKLFKIFNIVLYSPLVTILALIKGVKTESVIRTDGYTLFYRFPSSTIKIEKNCRFNSRSSSNLIGVRNKCIISTHKKTSIITIGKNSGFSGVSIGCFDSIRIGNNVKVGSNSLITDGDWHYEDPRSSEPRPVIIEDNVWIGFNCIILKGVTIGANSVIGAGSVVTKSIPPNCIAAGNPAKIIKTI